MTQKGSPFSNRTSPDSVKIQFIVKGAAVQSVSTIPSSASDAALGVVHRPANPQVHIRRRAANIAEGNGRFIKADRRNFFGIARGNVQECVPLLELAARQALLTSDQHQRLKSGLEEIARMLSGLINGLEKRRDGSDHTDGRCAHVDLAAQRKAE